MTSPFRHAGLQTREDGQDVLADLEPNDEYQKTKVSLLFSKYFAKSVIFQL